MALWMPYGTDCVGAVGVKRPHCTFSLGYPFVLAMKGITRAIPFGSYKLGFQEHVVSP